MTFYKEGDEVWVLNPNKSKLQPEKISPYVIIQVNKDTNTYTLRDFRGKYKSYHVDSFCLCKSKEHQRKAEKLVMWELLKKFQARLTNSVPKI